MPYDSGMDVRKIVSMLGGTNATARLCDIRPPSVSEWIAKNKIPKAQMKYLEAVRPDAFAVDVHDQLDMAGRHEMSA